MLSQMGNGLRKGTQSGERKKKKHFTKESTALDGDCPSPQGVENGDPQQAEKGQRLFLEDQAKRKERMKEVLNLKSSESVSDAESWQQRNQVDSSSMSCSVETSEHYETATQVSSSINSSMNHETSLHEVSRNATCDEAEPNGLAVEIQAASYPQSSLTHLSGNESDNYGVNGTVDGIPLPGNQQDLVTESVPGSFLPEIHADPPPSGQSNMVNASLPVDDLQPRVDDVPDRAVQGDHNAAPLLGQDGTHNDPATSLDQTNGNDADGGHECSVANDQNTLNSRGVVPQPGITATIAEAGLNNQAEQKRHRIPQEQNDYNQNAVPNQSISLTPHSKIESSTHPAMQIVSGVTEKTGSNHKEGGKLNVGEQSLSKAVRDNALLLEKISKYLDRENRIVKCWKHLAYVLGVPAEETRKFDHFTEHSPTEDMFNYLVDIWRPEVTVKELKEKLRNVYRNDIIESLVKGGFRDDMFVVDLMSGQPTFIALLSSKLDAETRTIGNWQSLATQFGIRKQKTEQFGLRGCGPTGELFVHMQTAKGLRDMTMGELRKHFKGMERNDLVKILEKNKFEETDSRLVINEVVDGSELLAEIGDRLNKEIRAVKNWRYLAYRMKIPLKVYNTFNTSKTEAKSPTKMMFDWLAQWKPGLHVDDLLEGLKKIDRFDVVDLVTKEVSAEIARKEEADFKDRSIMFSDGKTHQSAAKQTFCDLQQMHHNADKLHSQINLLPDLEKKAFEKGLVVSHNQGEGNCMFYALSEQLKVKTGTWISHGDLRTVLVRYLKEHPELPDGTNLYSFVYGYTSWEDYLDDMAKDGTWGDQMILFAAASNYGCVVHVISSVPNYEDVIISPPVHDAVELVLGHIFEQHYVSLLPIMSVRDVSDGVLRGHQEVPPAVGYICQNSQNLGYGQHSSPYVAPTQLMRLQEQHQPLGYHQPRDHWLPQRYQPGVDQKQRYTTNDRKMMEVRKLPYPVYNKICIKLNIKRDFFDDFRMVAEQLGVDRDTTEIAGQDRNPSEFIFSQCCPNVKVHELVDVLHKIERMDVAEELKRWITEG